MQLHNVVTSSSFLKNIFNDVKLLIQILTTVGTKGGLTFFMSKSSQAKFCKRTPVCQLTFIKKQITKQNYLDLANY